jgi:hypothetical protein
MSSAAASVKRWFTTAHSARFSAISDALLPDALLPDDLLSATRSC